MMRKYVLLAAAAALIPAAASAQGNVGGRVGLRLGYETPTVSGDGDVYKIGSAVSFGGEGGVDFHAGKKIVIGPFVEYDVSTVKNCEDGYCLKVKGTWNAGGRIGFLVGGAGQIYGKLNYSRITLKATSPTDSASDSKGGVGGAIGYEHGIGKSAYVSIEGNYADYGSWAGINLQRRQVVAGLGFRF
jgi:outer membrane immunogenic protein